MRSGEVRYTHDVGWSASSSNTRLVSRSDQKWMSLLKARVKDIKNIPLMVVGGIKAGIPTLVEDAEWCQQNNISTIVETADEKMLDCVMNVIKSRNIF